MEGVVLVLKLIALTSIERQRQKDQAAKDAAAAIKVRRHTTCCRATEVMLSNTLFTLHKG